MNSVDVLIYAEDPGAANYVAHLPAALMANSVNTVLLTDGLASSYLKERNIVSIPVQPQANAALTLDSYNPRLIIVGTSENVESFGLKLIEQAQIRGIVSAAVIDLQINADRRFCGRSNNPREYAPDWLLVADPGIQAAYEKLGFSSANIVVCGHPHYDYVRQVAHRLNTQNRAILRRRILPESSEERPVAVFVAEPASKLNPSLSISSSDYTMQGRGDSTFRTAIILQELLDAFAGCELAPYLVLRLHPKNSRDEFSVYENSIDMFNAGGDPLELIFIADLVVGMTSMLLQEAALMARPTLSILPLASEKSLLPSVASGLTPCVSTRAELREAISRWVSNWRVDPFRTKVKVEDINSVFPCHSSQKVVKFVVELIGAANVVHK